MEESSKLDNIDPKYLNSAFMILWLIYMALFRTSSEFEDSSIDPNGWFQWYFRYCLGRRNHDEEIHTSRWKGILSRYGKLVSMIKKNGRFE